MHPRRRFFGALIGLAVMGVSARHADATVLFDRTLDELAREADAVVVATPLDARTSRWQGGRIVTDVTVRVDAVLTGRVTASSDLVVRIPGGVVGDVGQSLSGAPTLTAGVPSVLFLTAPRSGARAVLSLSAGVLPVSALPGGAVVVLPARTEGLTLLPPSGPVVAARVVVPPAGLPLQTFAALLRGVVR